MQNQFQTTVAPFVGSSRFDLGHEVKCSTKMGILKPDLIVDTLPGDIFKDTTEFATRFEALLSPMMHRVNLYSYFFYVPTRLIWKNFKYWITGTQVPDQHTGEYIDPVEPTIEINADNWEYFKKGTLADYLGIPVPDEAPKVPLTVSALPFRAYQFIYNEYFRNQYLEPDLKGISFTDLDEVIEPISALTRLRTKWWEKDYFTSCFTQPQQGPPVQIPVSGNLNNLRIVFNAQYQTDAVDINTGQINGLYADNGGLIQSDMQDGANLAIDNSANLSIANADGEVSAGTIADLRMAQMLQQFLNLSHRAGERYIELIRAHFGVTSSDARLQRPEFLGGGKSPVQVSEVMQTSQTTEESPLGSYAGRAVVFGADHGFKSKFCEEHGWIMGLSTIFPRSAYQQGLERMWSRRDRLDYYWPTFAHLQEQPVYNQELFVDWKDLPDIDGVKRYENEGVFGYQARYMEYRTKVSRVAGEFRDTLSYWHLGRIFDRPPSLSISFASMRDSADTFTRPFAIQDGTDYIYQQIYHNLVAVRKMPKYVYPKF